MKPKHKRLLNISILFTLVALGVFLLVQNFRDNLIYFYSPSDLAKSVQNEPKKFEELLKKNKIRVGGMIKKSSLKKLGSSKFIFKATDFENDIKIYYQGILPPMFREGQGIVAEGKLQEFDKKKFLFKFKAEKLITKHDEKYMPPELKKIKNGK
ncbi:MAG: cytochrome c maturation protein CcmE [Rickettsiales bacterium]|nr:cytochrome c maturation protein CcmE [Rickettsiales bacterium]